MDIYSNLSQYRDPIINRNDLFKQKLLLILLLPPIIAGIGLVLYTSNKKMGFDNRSKASSTSVSLAFSPELKSVAQGEVISIGIILNPGNETVTAAELHLTYDRELEVESFIQNNYLPEVLSAASFGNGKASLILGRGTSETAHGSGIIATITFKALSSGTPSVRFDQETQIAALGHDDNVLQSLPPGTQITVSGSEIPVPSDTPVSECFGQPDQTPCTITDCPICPTESESVCPLRPCIITDGNCFDQQCFTFTPTPTRIVPTVTPTPTPTRTVPTVTLTPVYSICNSPQTGTKFKGDANCDSRISGLDYVIWLNTQCNPEGNQVCSDLRADYNSDSKVNNPDYNIWFSNSR